MQFGIGKYYQLVENTGQWSPDFIDVLEDGSLKLPTGGIFQCHGIDEDGDCLSETEGVLWKGKTTNAHGETVICASLPDLEAGTFIELPTEEEEE